MIRKIFLLSLALTVSISGFAQSLDFSNDEIVRESCPLSGNPKTLVTPEDSVQDLYARTSGYGGLGLGIGSFFMTRGSRNLLMKNNELRQAVLAIADNLDEAEQLSADLPDKSEIQRRADRIRLRNLDISRDAMMENLRKLGLKTYPGSSAHAKKLAADLKIQNKVLTGRLEGARSARMGGLVIGGVFLATGIIIAFVGDDLKDGLTANGRASATPTLNDDEAIGPYLRCTARIIRQTEESWSGVLRE